MLCPQRMRYVVLALQFGLMECGWGGSSNGGASDSSQTLEEWIEEELKVQPIRPLGPYVPPGSMVVLNEDSWVLLAEADACFSGPLALVPGQGASTTYNETFSTEKEIGVQLGFLADILPVSLEGQFQDSESIQITVSNTTEERVSTLQLSERINDPEFPEACRSLISAGVQIVHASVTAGELSVQSASHDGDALKAGFDIEEYQLDGEIGAESEDDAMERLDAWGPITLGVAVHLATDLVVDVDELPDVDAQLPEPVDAPDSDLTDPVIVIPDDVSELNPEGQDGFAWINCHRDCSSIKCHRDCNDEWMSCRSGCGLESSCSDLCDETRDTCSDTCRSDAASCGAVCDSAYL